MYEHREGYIITRIFNCCVLKHITITNENDDREHALLRYYTSSY